MRILITGGAGFVGSFLARTFCETQASCQVVVMDNLLRRGSELNLPLFRKLNIEFIHGDVRVPSDLDALPGKFDLMVEASAEPSVQAGSAGDPDYVLQSNLIGTMNCLRYARHNVGVMVFLSTSRVYSIAPLQELPLRETNTRFELSSEYVATGVSEKGVTEAFSVNLPRSFYGASKLASEYLIQEYVHAYDIKAVCNRCGVIAGPGQFGKVDQGVFTLWVARHHFSSSLTYTGFGGRGKQVRDLLHPIDLFDLIIRQIEIIDECTGDTFNIGGGRDNDVSLHEFSELCQNVTGNKVPITRQPDTNVVDIPWYVSDNSKAEKQFGWSPQVTPLEIVTEISDWLNRNQSELRQLFV